MGQRGWWRGAVMAPRGGVMGRRVDGMAGLVARRRNDTARWGDGATELGLVVQ